MSETISKELLKAVLVIDEKYLQEIIVVDNEVFWTGGDINIYELAHKCKELAFKQGYSLNVFNSNSNYYEVTPNTLSDDNEEWVEHPYSIASSEPEAIFKACQYILENKDK